jgi:chorismate mutase
MHLREIREVLRRAEDSIIFALLERARWKVNREVYSATPSLFVDVLVKTEIAHSEVGRYQCPEEHPFTTISIPPTGYRNKQYSLSKLLMDNHSDINHNVVILEQYLEHILPMITSEGTDENAGSAAVADVILLQAISRRIHLGKAVAEIKFSDPESTEKYQECVDRESILTQLTNQTVENSILNRVRQKASVYGGDDSDSSLPKEVIVSVFRDYIIPQTKAVQVDYLTTRLGFKDA